MTGSVGGSTLIDGGAFPISRVRRPGGCSGGCGCRGGGEGELALSSSDEVSWAQRSLNRSGARLTVTGVPSPAYVAAVRAFQRRNGLPPTGRVDRATRDRLIVANERGRAYVRWIQRRLNALSAGLKVDGIKGPLTTRAVRTYQAKRVPPLRVDGLVGPRTERRLRESGCSVPGRATERFAPEFEDEYALEIDQPELVRPRAVALARLCLFLNAPVRAERNHFECGALRQARRIAALKEPNPSRCPRRIGATPFDTGADIIAAINATRTCTGRAVDAVHVFGHGFPSGIPGPTMGHVGLYQNAYSGTERSLGGRAVTDVPTTPLAQNVTFVLHGCNTAFGDDNIARSLFGHLARALTSPTVIGHTNTGCAGRNNSWRTYSSRVPRGRDSRTVASIASSGCCGP
jgi:hypothetical protein